MFFIKIRCVINSYFMDATQIAIFTRYESMEDSLIDLSV